MSDLVSASSLKRCGHARVLQKLRPPSANSRVAMARGSVFHKAVEDWAATGTLVMPEGDEEIAGWLALLESQWRPQRGMRFELAVGLNVDGGYTPVVEPKPHVYVPAQDSVPTEYLLTAGRADVAWLTMPTRTRRRCYVNDWKTGSFPPEQVATNLQFWSLGLAICQMFQCDEVCVGAYHARDGVFEWSDPVARDSDEWAARLADVRAAATVGEKPMMSETNCNPCWERRSCEYYNKVMVDAAKEIESK